LLRLLEDWKVALDKNQYVAAIPMDLSKVFDCLPHDILLCKLSAYAFLQILYNYFKIILLVVSNKSNFREFSAVGLISKKVCLKAPY
jgi:hypothetical protein